MQPRRRPAPWRSSAGSASPGTAQRRPAGRLPQRRRLPHHRHRPRARPHPDPLPARPLHRDRRRGQRVADTRAAPPHQPDLPRADPVRATPTTQPRSRILNRTRDRDFAQNATTASRASGAISTAAGRCDPLRLSGRLRRRHVARAQGDRRALQGDAVVQRVQSTFIRAPDLLGIAAAPAGMDDLSLNPRRGGNVYAIDGREPGSSTTTCEPDEAVSSGRPRLGDPHDPRRRRRTSPTRSSLRGLVSAAA